MPRQFALAVSAAVLAGALWAGPALGGEEADIAGVWRLRTATFPNGCKIDGQMTLKRLAANRYACVFETKQTCPGFSGGAKQTCTAARTGQTVTMKSAVTAFDWEGGSYAPDDFDLKIVSPTYMHGQFSSTHKSGVDQAEVEFFRGPAPQS